MAVLSSSLAGSADPRSRRGPAAGPQGRGQAAQCGPRAAPSLRPADLLTTFLPRAPCSTPPPPLPVSPSPPLLPLSLGTYMALHIPWVGLPNRAFLILTLGPLSLPHAISVCSHSDPEWVLPRMPAWPGAGEGEMAETGRSKQTRGEVLC